MPADTATPATATPAATTPAATTPNLPVKPAATGSKLPAKRAATGRSEQTEPDQHRRAAQQAVAANSTHVDLRLGGAELHLTLPPVDKLAFYAGLAAAATFGVVEWPIALLTGIGHALSDDRRNRTLHALGEALDAV